MNLLLIEKSETEIVTVEIAESSGMAYADRFRVVAKWDIFTPDPRSQQVVLRQSYAIHWLDKPFGVWKIIDPLAHEQMEEDSEKSPKWFKETAATYKKGLKSGIYSPPS